MLLSSKSDPRLNKAVQRISLPGPEEMTLRQEICDTTVPLFETCKTLHRPGIYEWNKKYPKQWKLDGGLHRITRWPSTYCKIEFPYNGMLATVEYDGSKVEGSFPAQNVRDSFTFRTLNPSNVKNEAKIRLALVAMWEAVAKIEAFQAQESARVVEETWKKVNRLVTP